MSREAQHTGPGYRDAMGRLLMLYTQIDRLIMQSCAERIGSAPDEPAQLALARQVGDEGRHVSIQTQWIQEFGSDPSPVISETQEQQILAYFRSLTWLEFLADMYLAVEALGSDAVERIVPLADPGTRESLRIPLQDEVDHIAFGMGRLKLELAALPEARRQRFLQQLPDRLDRITRSLHGLGLDLPAMFEAAGADYDRLRTGLLARRKELLQELAA